MSLERYNAKDAEPRWQAVWAERGLFTTRNDDPRPKYYVLEMFPYPSGRIHMGHVRHYAMPGAAARHRRAKGADPAQPTGEDSLGRPAQAPVAEDRPHAQP